MEDYESVWKKWNNQPTSNSGFIIPPKIGCGKKKKSKKSKKTRKHKK